MALRDHGRVERPVQAHDDGVVRRGQRRRVAEPDAAELGPVDQTLAAQEADRELVLVARRAHRHGDRHGLLAGPGGPDLERLLGRDAIRAHLQRRPRTARMRVLETCRVGGDEASAIAPESTLGA